MTSKGSVMAPPTQSAASEAHESLCKLPVFRAVALKVMKLTSDEESSLAEVAKLLESDPGLSTEIVALANSPLYGSRNEIRSVKRAIAQLGFERTKSLTVTAALGSFARGGQDTPAMRRTWRHSFCCAVLAEELAEAFAIDRNAAYTAGLLHDVGRLGLLAAYPAKYGGLLDASYDDAAGLLREEKQLMGMDHCQAGMLLSRTWGFPEELQQVAGGHLEAAAGVAHDLKSSVRSACLMASALGFGAVSLREFPGMEQVVGELPGPRQRWSRFTSEEMRNWVQQRLDSTDLQ